MAAKLSLFMPHSVIANQIEQLLWIKFFNTIFSLESDQMTALWATDILDFTYSIANWTIFVKEMFWFDAVQRVMKWLLYDEITVKLSLYKPYFQIAYQTEQLL